MLDHIVVAGTATTTDMEEIDFDAPIEIYQELSTSKTIQSLRAKGFNQEHIDWFLQVYARRRALTPTVSTLAAWANYLGAQDFVSP